MQMSDKPASGIVAWAVLGRWLAVALSVALLVGCQTAAPIRDTGLRSRLIHVTSNGWHTAIVVPAQALADSGAIPEAADFPDAAFLEFGWGDRV
ncbi:MAG: DUF2459 domain-containing protein, partial [Candidatus Tectomicrobia bacterium]|nr:DUF2459 domain-containing protein [Candidatus Tectomicrobia bacterium]